LGFTQCSISIGADDLEIDEHGHVTGPDQSEDDQYDDQPVERISGLGRSSISGPPYRPTLLVS
jgi:hypothetical protein